jgi:hypothetical protein
MGYKSPGCSAGLASGTDGQHHFQQSQEMGNQAFLGGGWDSLGRGDFRDIYLMPHGVIRLAADLEAWYKGVSQVQAGP